MQSIVLPSLTVVYFRHVKTILWFHNMETLCILVSFWLPCMDVYNRGFIDYNRSVNNIHIEENNWLGNGLWPIRLLLYSLLQIIEKNEERQMPSLIDYINNPGDIRAWLPSYVGTQFWYYIIPNEKSNLSITWYNTKIWSEYRIWSSKHYNREINTCCK